MALFTLDTNARVCLVWFYLPKGATDTLTYLKGKVVISGQEGVMVDEGVAAAGASLPLIISNHQNNQGVFSCQLSTNTRRQSESDPKWFASFVENPIPAGNGNEGAARELEAVRDQLNDLIQQLRS